MLYFIFIKRISMLGTFIVYLVSNVRISRKADL